MCVHVCDYVRVVSERDFVCMCVKRERDGARGDVTGGCDRGITACLCVLMSACVDVCACV